MHCTFRGLVGFGGTFIATVHCETVCFGFKTTRGPGAPADMIGHTERIRGGSDTLYGFSEGSGNRTDVGLSLTGRPRESLRENTGTKLTAALEPLSHCLIPSYPLSTQRNSCMSAAAGTERSDKIEPQKMIEHSLLLLSSVNGSPPIPRQRLTEC